MTRSLAVIVAAGILLAGCSSTSVRYADRTVTAGVVRERVSENQQRVRALAGSGRISIETPEIAQSGSFELALRKPDSLLLKIEGPFGIDVGSAMVTREQFSLYDSFQNRLIEGPTSAANLSKVFHIRIDFDDVLNLFTGGFFLLEDDAEPSEFSVEDEEFVLTYNSFAGTRRYWVDPQSMQILKIHHVDANGRLTLEEIFSKFETHENVTIPHYVRVTMVQERRRVSIAYSEVSVNPSGMEFVFEVPKNASRSRLQ